MTLSGVPSEPYSRRDLAGFGVCMLLVLTGLAVAWLGASGELRPDGQVGWLNVGVASAGASLAVNWRLLRSGRHQIAVRRVATSALLMERGSAELAPPGHASAAVTTPAPAETPVSASNMTRYHRPNCLLVRNKATTARSRQVHETAGRRPCGVCQP